MKKIGTVKNIARDGHIILRGSAEVRPGDAVQDARGRKVGRVDRVFGPVSGPYISVRPTVRLDVGGLPGSSLYMGPSGPGKKKGVKQRQRRRKPQRK